MKIFLSGLEQNPKVDIDKLLPMKYNLCSYFYLRSAEERTKKIIDNSELVMIDSGAHSFQKGIKVPWEEYTEQYAEWIRQNDEDKIVGYFEMDVDNIIGYENVLKLRKELEKVTDKIIPVWHKNRGLEDFKNMCLEYSGKIIAITGFRNEDIKDSQYLQFLKYAWSKNCKVHCLGMTRQEVLKKVPFDYVDSSSWAQEVIYGKSSGLKYKYPNTTEERRKMREIQWVYSYNKYKNLQEYYEHIWEHTTKVAKEKLLAKTNDKKIKEMIR